MQGFADRRNAGAFGVQLSYSHLLLLPVWPRLELRNKQWRLRVVKQPLSHIEITLALTCQCCIICIATSPAKSQTDLPNYELSPQITLIRASNFFRVRIKGTFKLHLCPRMKSLQFSHSSKSSQADYRCWHLYYPKWTTEDKIFIKLGPKLAVLCVKSRSQKAVAVFHWVLHDPGGKGGHNANNVLQQWQNKEESKEF